MTTVTLYLWRVKAAGSCGIKSLTKKYKCGGYQAKQGTGYDMRCIGNEASMKRLSLKQQHEGASLHHAASMISILSNKIDKSEPGSGSALL